MNEEQINKIRALALESTNANERDNARRILERLNQPLHDPKKSKPVRFDMTFGDKHEEKLLIQIIFSVCPSAEVAKYNKGRKFEVECPAPEAEQIKLLWGVYKRELKALLVRSVTAFIHANRIFPPPKEEDEDDEKPSKYDRDELLALSKLANAIDPTRVPRALLTS